MLVMGCITFFSAYVQQGAADTGTLISPSGSITDSTPRFIWENDPDATWYQLWIESSGQDIKIKQWHTASDVCEENTCSTTIETSLPESEYEWFVRYLNSRVSAVADYLN